MDKKAKQNRAKAEENALNHVLCWLAGGAVLEFLLILLHRYWENYTMDQFQMRLALGSAVKILAVAALAGAVAAGFWWNRRRKAGRHVNLLPGTVGLFLAGVSVGCFAAWLFPGTGVNLMCSMVPVVIVLALIYYLYQREFFLVACQSALALMGVWIYGRGILGRQGLLGYAVCAAVLILAAAAVCWSAQKNQGQLKRRAGGQVRLFPKEANYTLLYVGAVIALAVLACTAAGLSAVLLSAVGVAWLLIMAVYYTMKLI